MNYETNKTEKWLIMNDIQKRAMEIIETAKREKGEFGGYTFCAGLVGFRYPKKLWREAKDAGFEKGADGRWTGWIKSFNGEESIAEIAYGQALREKKEEMLKVGAHTSFLDNVTVYEYLT